MSYRIEAADASDLGLLTERTGYPFAAGAAGLVARDGRGIARALLAFDRWMPSSAHIHVYLDEPAALRPLLRPAFRHAFVTNDLRVLLATIPVGARSLGLALHAGFHETHRTLDGWSPDVDLVHLELRREECRYL